MDKEALARLPKKNFLVLPNGLIHLKAKIPKWGSNIVNYCIFQIKYVTHRMTAKKKKKKKNLRYEEALV